MAEEQDEEQDQPDAEDDPTSSMAEKLGKLSGRLENDQNNQHNVHSEILDLLDSGQPPKEETIAELVRPQIAPIAEHKQEIADEDFSTSEFGQGADTDIYKSLILLEHRLESIEQRIDKIETELLEAQEKLEQRTENELRTEVENIVEGLLLSEAHSRLRKDEMVDEVLAELSRRIQTED